MDRLHTLQLLVEALRSRRGRLALVALRPESGQDEWTYERLATDITRLAAGLRETGVSRGTVIAILAGNSAEWIVACLAALEAGAVVAPLDLQLSDETLRHVLADSGARFIVTTAAGQERLRRVAPASARRTILLDAEGDKRSWRRLIGDAGGAPPPEVKPDDPAALFYTSGTTGPPKGVPLTHANIASQLQALLELDLLEHDDHVLLPLPLHHVYPFVLGLLMPLVFGMTIVLPQSLTGPELVRAMREGRVTVIIGVPRLYRSLIDAVETRAASRGWLAALGFRAMLGGSTLLRRRLGLRVGRRLLRAIHARIGPQVRVVVSGGAALDPELAWKLEGFGWQLGTGYGLTETSPMLSVGRPGASRIGSVGRPLPGVQVRIMPLPGDAADARAPGSGEIQAKGPNVFGGYLHEPSKSAEVFTRDGWFRTGDLGHLDADGWLYVDGRSTELIKTESGEKVQPEEIERLFQGDPALREVAVLQVEGRLVALVVPATHAPSAAEVRSTAEQAIRERSRRLPSYSRITAVAIAREPLPRTRLGKLRRHLLPELYAQALHGTAQRRRAERPVDVSAMAASDQELLANRAARATWELLSELHARHALSPESSLQLDLGVDSLEWLNLTTAIGQRARVELDEGSLGALETVRDLLQAVSVARPARGQRQRSPLEDPERVLGARQRSWMRRPGPVRLALTRVAWAFDRLLARLLFHVRAEGLERLPRTGAVVLAPNHGSHLDAFVIAALLDPERLRRTYWAAWTGVAFTNAMVRLLSRLGQVVPVDPERGASSSLAFGVALLKRGDTLVWFPEGQRTRDGRLQPFKAGLGLIVQAAPAPIVPVHIEGTFEALPRGRIVPRPRHVTVRFGRPLDPRDLERRGHGDDPAERIVHALRRHVAALARSSVPHRRGARPALRPSVQRRRS